MWENRTHRFRTPRPTPRLPTLNQIIIAISALNDPGIGATLRAMPYTRRRTWPDSDREDYVIRCEGLDVGRSIGRGCPTAIASSGRST